LAATAYGVSDFAGGLASRKAPTLSVIIVSYPISLVLVLVVAPFAGGSITANGWIWGGIGGLASAIAVWTFYLALARGPMSVVSPVAAVVSAAVPVAAGLFMGERPTTLAYAGIAIALAAVILISREDSEQAEHVPKFTRKVAVLSIVSGLSFAFSFIALDRFDADEGMWPLAVTRGASAVLVIAASLLVVRGLHPARGQALWLAAVVATLDVIANGALMYAYHGGLLSLVSVIAALYPAATVLLAMLLLGERVSRVQQAGMLAALAAVGMIAVAS
jgi:drug/metabolite transporter (DMT)-like permease